MGAFIEVTDTSLWKIVHKQLATDHYTYGTTVVKASSKEEALRIFNRHIADERYLMKAKSIEYVYPFEYWDKR